MSFSRTVHTSLSEVAIAGRLLDACAHCADRRDLKDQLSLSPRIRNSSCLMVVSRRIRGREGGASLFENLKAFEATTHFNGLSTVTWKGVGMLNCLARLVKVEGTSWIVWV